MGIRKGRQGGVYGARESLAEYIFFFPTQRGQYSITCPRELSKLESLSYGKL